MPAAPPSALRLGVLGCAGIAEGFVAGLRGSDAVRVDAVASRDGARAEAFAARHGIARAHAGYEALLADPGLDAVYNPLPNSLHAEWSERALRAGLHVLCEKPLTLDLAQALALFATARQCGRVLLEAFPYRYQPQTLLMQRLVADGAIGEVRQVQAYFGFSLADGPNIRLDPALGGGALLDAGCYAVSLARLAVGRRPLAVLAQARWGSTGVDLGLTGSVHYEGGAVAQIGCAMDAALQRSALIVGTQGVIETDYQNHTHDERLGVLRLRRSPGWQRALEAQAFERGNGFRYEAEHFAALVRHGAPVAEPDLDTRLSLDNMATLQALLASARSGRAEPVAGWAAP